MIYDAVYVYNVIIDFKMYCVMRDRRLYFANSIRYIIIICDITII